MGPEPDLPVAASESVLEGVPGALADASPDAWGRNLITRRHARQRAGHAPPPLSEAELLLAVSDATRQGALRLSTGDGFVADAGVPDLIELERLLQAAEEVASGAPDADLRLAEACGLAVAPHRLEIVASAPVLLSQRFDRAGSTRIPYLSARSLVGAGGRPGDYLEVAEAIADHGIEVVDDLRELWARARGHRSMA